ncbi:MAG: methionine gamma-lyase family protein [Bacilli bacterium]|nr:methionine gamma-lyase family protein [Bacilli bacterium]
MSDLELIEKCESELNEEFLMVDKITFINSKKVMDAFQLEEVMESDFNETTGYGYNDTGRDKIERIYSRIFKAESAVVRGQFISASHALCVTLFALLRPGDLLLSVTGKPYDTLDEVIGIRDNPSSLKSFGINYDQIDLVDDDFDYDRISEYISKNKVKVIEIQRSKGYSTRKSISIEKVSKLVDVVRSIDKDVIIMVDNCYCEFVTDREPIEVGCDVAVGSLIKNLGGGISPNGAYVVGRCDLINLVGERLTLPGEGLEVGPSLGMNKKILQGLYMAPSVVGSALKTAILTSKVMEEKGFVVEPRYNDERCDIVQNITFGSRDLMVKFTSGIQRASAIDSNTVVEGWDMPGYVDQVVMASGSFTQGSSIELSCDGPLREPYIAYMQGSLTYDYGKLGLLSALEYLEK